MPEDAPPPGPGRLRERWLFAAVIAVGVLAYANTFTHDAIFDGRAVLENMSAVRDPFAVLEILKAPYALQAEGVAGGYRPLTVWTLAVGYRLNEALGQPGAHATVQHLGNVLAFGAVCGLLAVFLRRTLRTPLAVVASASLLFAVHPVHSEVVAGIVGRAELLAALFGLALLVTHRAGRNPAVCALLLLAALLSKESALGFAVAALAWDALRPPRTGTRWRSWHLAAYVAVALLWWFGLRAGAVGGADVISDAEFLQNPLRALPAHERVFTALTIQLDYLRLLVFPLELSTDYTYAETEPVRSLLDLRVLGFLAIFAGALALAWRCRRRHPRITLAVLAYAALFAPTSNLLLPIGTCQGERLLFSPSLFACLLAGEGIARAGKGRAVRVVAVLVLGLLLARTLNRNHVWSAEEPFLEAQLRDAPRSSNAHLIAGHQDYLAGRFEEALGRYEAGHELYPSPRSTLCVGRALEALGRHEEALRCYEPLEAADPGRLDVGQRVVRLLLKLGRLDEARQRVERLEELHHEQAPLKRLRAALSEHALRHADSPRYPGLRLVDEGPLQQLLTSAGSPAFERRVQLLYRDREIRSLLILTHLFLALRWDPSLTPRHPRDYRMPKLLVWFVLERKVASVEHLRLTQDCLRAAGRPDERARAGQALLDWTLAARSTLTPEAGPFGSTIFRAPTAPRAGDASAEFAGLNAGEADLLRATLAAPGAALFDAWLGEVTGSPDPHAALILAHLAAELPWQPALAPTRPDDDRMRKVRVWKALHALVDDPAFEALSQGYRDALGQVEGDSHAALVSWLREHVERLGPHTTAAGQRVFRLSR